MHLTPKLNALLLLSTQWQLGPQAPQDDVSSNFHPCLEETPVVSHILKFSKGQGLMVTSGTSGWLTKLAIIPILGMPHLMAIHLSHSGIDPMGNSTPFIRCFSKLQFPPMVGLKINGHYQHSFQIN